MEYALDFLFTMRNTDTARLIAICYHRIIEEGVTPFFNSMNNGSPGIFKQELEFISRYGEVISAEGLADAIKKMDFGKGIKFLITFDDGYSDLYHNAYPVLRQLKLPAAVFLTVNCVEDRHFSLWTDKIAFMIDSSGKDLIKLPGLGAFRLRSPRDRQKAKSAIIEKMKSKQQDESKAIMEDLAECLEADGSLFPADCYLDSVQIKEMAKNGISFGSHTCSHPILTKITFDAAEREIRESKRKLEALLGRQIHGFAYPNGTKKDFNEKIKDMVKQSGYMYAFSMVSGDNIAPPGLFDRYALKRINAGTSFDILKNNLRKFL